MMLYLDPLGDLCSLKGVGFVFSCTCEAPSKTLGNLIENPWKGASVWIPWSSLQDYLLKKFHDPYWGLVLRDRVPVA